MTMAMALKMTIKDVDDSNVEDHNRIKGTDSENDDRARAKAKANNVDHRDYNDDVIDIDDDEDDDNNNNNVDNHFIDVNYGNKIDDSNDEKVPMGTVPRRPKVSEWQTSFSLQ